MMLPSNPTGMFMTNKKGFTLLEVVVALGILAIALAGAVTLVTTALHLMTTARDTTQANVLVQKGLSDGIASVCTTCNATTINPGSGYSPKTVADNGVTRDGFWLHDTSTHKTVVIKFNDSFTAPLTDTLINSVSPGNYTKITSTVYRDGDQNNAYASATQYVGNGS
jgi:prepilin-type N-terminal cleavage/methylation domain-containing protein